MVNSCDVFIYFVCIQCFFCVHCLVLRFQELDLSAQCLISNESNREDMWREAIEVTLKKKGNFVKVHTKRSPLNKMTVNSPTSVLRSTLFDW